MLESALHQSQNLFAYGNPSLLELATVYAERIAKNHPFADGNKRTAYVVMRLFLNLNGYELRATREERVTKFVQLASSQVTANDFSAWLKDNVQEIK